VAGKQYTLKEASEITGYEASTLRREAIAGRLVATKFGTTWVVSEEALNIWLKSESRQPNKKGK
jgi:excisionase family DNA binding protein